MLTTLARVLRFRFLARAILNPRRNWWFLLITAAGWLIRRFRRRR